MSNPENTSLSPISPATGSARGVSPWWRVGAIACAIVLLTPVASALSLYEQFRTLIKTISIRTRGQHPPAILITQDPQEFTLQLQRLPYLFKGVVVQTTR